MYNSYLYKTYSYIEFKFLYSLRAVECDVAASVMHASLITITGVLILLILSEVI